MGAIPKRRSAEPREICLECRRLGECTIPATVRKFIAQVKASGIIVKVEIQGCEMFEEVEGA